MKLFGLPIFLAFFFVAAVTPVGLTNFEPSKSHSYSQLNTVTSHSFIIDDSNSNLNKIEFGKPSEVSLFLFELAEKPLFIYFPESIFNLRQFTLSYISRFITSPPDLFPS